MFNVWSFLCLSALRLPSCSVLLFLLFFCFTHGETGVSPVSSSVCVCVCFRMASQQPAPSRVCSLQLCRHSVTLHFLGIKDVAQRWNADPNQQLYFSLLLTLLLSLAPLALSEQKMKTLAQRRQSAPSLVISKALTRSRSTSRWEGTFLKSFSLPKKASVKFKVFFLADLVDTAQIYTDF